MVVCHRRHLREHLVVRIEVGAGLARLQRRHREADAPASTLQRGCGALPERSVEDAGGDPSPPSVDLHFGHECEIRGANRANVALLRKPRRMYLPISGERMRSELPAALNSTSTSVRVLLRWPWLGGLSRSLAQIDFEWQLELRVDAHLGEQTG